MSVCMCDYVFDLSQINLCSDYIHRPIQAAVKEATLYF